METDCFGSKVEYIYILSPFNLQSYKIHAKIRGMPLKSLIRFSVKLRRNKIIFPNAISREQTGET